MSRSLPVYSILPGTLPAEEVIRSNTLQPYLEAQDVLSQAHEEAQEITQQATSLLADTQAQVKTIQAQAKEAGLKDAHIAIDQACQEAVANTIQWLVKTQELEQSVVNRLENRIRNYLAQIFSEFSRSQDQIELVLHRISKHLPEFIAQGRLTLRLNAPTRARIEATLGSARAARIHIITDHTLQPGQAILDGELVRVVIDVEQHGQALLKLLNNQFIESQHDDSNHIEQLTKPNLQNNTLPEQIQNDDADDAPYPSTRNSLNQPHTG
ncbi:MAG: hypothetical protein IT497_10205 [Ottowia sp.]|nr:hypothetical protein [Ottowia sp.]